MEGKPNLLDESLTLPGDGGAAVVLIEDRVETSGAFVLHHLLKRVLSSQPQNVVVFVSFANPFSHYDRVLRKMGCNLAVQRDNKRLLFFDMRMLECPDEDGRKTVEGGLIALYGKIQKAVEVNSSGYLNGNVTIMVDDVSLMEVAAKGSSKYVLDFLHYCHTLTTQFGCMLVTLNHEDIYSTEDNMALLQMEYLANIIIKAEPLITGLATDVHGQLTVYNKGACDGLGSSRSKIRNFHFRVKENSADFFFPGSRT